MLLLPLIPPLATLLLVLTTRSVVFSLAVAVLVGSILKTGASLNSLSQAASYLAGAVASKENAYSLLFLVLFGAVAELIRMSGGVTGFTRLAERWLKSERGVLLSVWGFLPVTFFDKSFRSLSVGSVLKPLLDKVQGSRERLAFVLTVTTGQVIVLLPLATAYVGYMVSLIRANLPAGFEGSLFGLYVRSLVWNFYSPVMLLVALGVTLWSMGFGSWKFTLVKGGGI